jgi:electron transport complex protein RnfE
MRITAKRARIIYALIIAFLAGVVILVASLMLKNFPRWVRMGIYSIINLLVVLPVMYVFERFSLSLFSSLGVYLPLMVMSSFNCVHCEKYAVKHSVKLSFFDAVASLLGYCSVLMAVGLIREVFGNGTFLGVNIPFVNGMSGLLMPFGGLLIIGILAAAHKAHIIKKYPAKLREIETKFALDESDDKEATLSYAVKNRFKKSS